MCVFWRVNLIILFLFLGSLRHGHGKTDKNKKTGKASGRHVSLILLISSDKALQAWHHQDLGRTGQGPFLPLCPFSPPPGEA